MKEKKLFNPSGDDNVASRTIIKGNTTGLFQLNAVKYNWANSLYNVMVGNFWLPEKVKGLGDDALQLEKLSEDEQRAYKGILSFLIFLDSLQTVNLPNFSDYITAPEVNLILSIQTFQEAIHAKSYATILEGVVPVQEREEYYYFWRDSEHLLKRNEFIGNIYEDFLADETDENFFKGIIGNFILEGLYFYNGFAFFDTLASQGKMVATDRMINYIRRDELTHVTLFANILREIKTEFPDMYKEQVIIDMFKEAVKQEIEWSSYILGGKIPGMSNEMIEQYTKYLADSRLKMIGIKPLYNIKKNPFSHLEVLQDNNADKGNFFESTVTNYAQSSSMKGSWDF